MANYGKCNYGKRNVMENYGKCNIMASVIYGKCNYGKCNLWQV